jgi:hypothetical protein
MRTFHKPSLDPACAGAATARAAIAAAANIDLADTVIDHLWL